ncbi:MAG: PIG-L family deacetylase [Saprospiraceae bacterium]|nr:PIG-L family deacetylase [Saprospiraceae bacterium]
MNRISRRQLVKSSGGILGMSLLGLPFGGRHHESPRLKVVVTGGHPDDPETGCGGLIKLLTLAGHNVKIAYLTRGEAGINGTSHIDAASIRTEEALSACQILGGEANFLGQIDGDTFVNKDEYENMFQFLKKEAPDLILTHWPIDTHRDHRACSALTYAAWTRLEKKAELYFYEVLSGNQTQNFVPTDYVDISDVRAIKHEACFAHKSQKIEENYANDHGKMEEFRGMEGNVRYAEAFVRHVHNSEMFER